MGPASDVASACEQTAGVTGPEGCAALAVDGAAHRGPEPPAGRAEPAGPS